MSIIIILGLICIICSVLMFVAKEYGKALPLINKISVILLLCFLIVGFSVKFSSRIHFTKYYVLKNSIEDLRKQEGKLQSTFITQAIIEMNAKLATFKTLNNTVFEIFIPDYVAQLTYLK